MTDLTILGSRVEGAITAEQLETFPAPKWCTGVDFTTRELTAFCPITHQPDLYEMTLNYRPRNRCIESKSLKLYLHGYRDKGAFCETLASMILADIVTACQPRSAFVTLRQQVRGGLELTATSTYESDPQ